MTDSSHNFTEFLVEGMTPNRKKISQYVDNSLMLVTALSPVIGYDKASQIAHHAFEHDLTLKDAALSLGYISAEDFDRAINPRRMTHP
jgi:fumarate hydratase class II